MLCALALLCVARPWRTGRTLSAIPLLALAGAGWWAAARPAPSAPSDPGPLRLQGTLAEDPVLTPVGPRLLLDLEGSAPAASGPWSALCARAAVQVLGFPRPPAARGDVAVLRAKLRPPWGFRNPGTRGFEAYLARREVGLRATVVWPGEIAMAAPGPDAPAWLRWRRNTARAISDAVPGQTGAVLRALALGDWSLIEPETKESFRRSGTTHLVAISGLHLGVVALLTVPVLRRLLLCLPTLPLAHPVDPIARLLALPVLAGYTALCGFQTSALRALAMTSLLLAGTALSRAASPLVLLCSAALVLGVASPRVLGDPGLHLSLAALVGLFWLAPKLEARLTPSQEPDPLRPPPSRVVRLGAAAGAFARRLFCAGVAASLATAPVSAFHFGASSLLGLVLNPVAVPAVEFGSLPLALAGTLLHGVWPAGAAALWRAAGLGVFGLLEIQRLLAPWAVSLASPWLRTPWGLVGSFGVLFGAASALDRPPRLGRAALVAAAGLAAITVPQAVGTAAAALDPRLHLWMLDVGQGQALALRLPGRPKPQWVLVDAGGIAGTGFDVGERVVAPALEALGCGRLALAVSTHPHPDHLEGMPTAVRLGRPAALWLPGAYRGDERYAPVLAAAAEVGSRVEWIEGERQFALGDARFNVRATDGPAENDRGLLLRVRCGGLGLLLPADLEATGQEQLLASGFSPRCDLLVAPHHGSANATYGPFLDAARPGTILISASGRGRLPSATFVQEARRLGARVSCTAEAGCLHAALGSGGLTLTAAAEGP